MATKEVDLLSYWMPVLRKIKEFKEIAKAEEPELRYLLEAIDRTLSNFFITTADEYGISRFENMMGIFPDEDEGLETRRFNVLIKWNDKVPYTDEELYNRLLSLCGKGNFTITPHYEEYRINITTAVGIKGVFDAVTTLLQDMLPCNLVLELKNILKAEKTTPLYVGVVASTAMAYIITHDIEKEYLNSSPTLVGVGVGKAGTHIITHDVGIKNRLSNPINEGIGVGVANTTLITHDIESNATIQGNSAVGIPVSTATVITIKS